MHSEQGAAILVTPSSLYNKFLLRFSEGYKAKGEQMMDYFKERMDNEAIEDIEDENFEGSNDMIEEQVPVANFLAKPFNIGPGSKLASSKYINIRIDDLSVLFIVRTRFLIAE